MPTVLSSLRRIAVPAIATILALGVSVRAEEPDRFEASLKKGDRQHWAFQPVIRPAVPTVLNRDWVRTPIDAFLLARMEERGWRPAEPASQQALMRRVYLDLIGLPPTLAEQDRFLRDRSPNALDRLTAELLARPEYGERWGRHWLDLVRYAETNGYERDAAKPSVWRYRDYVIRSFNDDKPYDRFVLEQLAGDELPDATPETILATGYFRLGPWDDEPADVEQDRFDQLDDLVSTTSQVFLGLTLGCARCHNHKFEPLGMRDYYGLAAVFQPLRRPQSGRTEFDLPAVPRADAKRLLRSSVSPTVASLAPALAAPIRVALLQQTRPLFADYPPGYFMTETSATLAPSNIMIRGQATRPGPEVRPRTPAIVSPQPEFGAPANGTSQRRISLARWIASERNPLTARVIVNRVWQFHFGEGLVRTPSDFGTAGEKPTHPELLDWLADRFVRDGWSIKALHRLILSSNVYRMSKALRPEYARSDPDNRLWTRLPYRRLDVEAIRDSALAASGQLERTLYGPSVYPHIPKEALEGSSDPGTIWRAFDEKHDRRRTVYTHTKRSMIVPLLEALDFCDTTRTSAQRTLTTVAPQALTLFNGDFANRQARHLANRLRQEVGADRAAQLERAYRLTVCRPPTAAETAELLRFQDREQSRAIAAGLSQDAAKERALVQACRVLLNTNEFVYAD